MSMVNKTISRLLYLVERIPLNISNISMSIFIGVHINENCINCTLKKEYTSMTIVALAKITLIHFY